MTCCRLTRQPQRVPRGSYWDYPRVSARDAVHLAVMERHEIQRILTFDIGFDGFPGITRLS